VLDVDHRVTQHRGDFDGACAAQVVDLVLERRRDGRWRERNRDASRSHDRRGLGDRGNRRRRRDDLHDHRRGRGRGCLHRFSDGRVDREFDPRIADLDPVAGRQLRLVDPLPVDERAASRTEIDDADVVGARDLDDRVHATDGLVVEPEVRRRDLAELDHT